MMNRVPFIKQLPDEAALLRFAGELAQSAKANSIIFLQGPLGAGKTTFARGFLRGLGYQEKVKSPTYTLVEPYEFPDFTVYHFDLYRLKTSKELDQLGVEDYFSPTAICLIEWPEHGYPVLPEPDLTCELAFKAQGREIRMEAFSEIGHDIIERMIAKER